VRGLAGCGAGELAVGDPGAAATVLGIDVAAGLPVVAATTAVEGAGAADGAVAIGTASTASRALGPADGGARRANAETVPNVTTAASSDHAHRRDGARGGVAALCGITADAASASA
jgi:hypothetical protein